MRKGVRKEYLKGTRRHGGYNFPLDKFLHSRIGKAWSNVHAELSAEFDRRTRAGYEFWRWFNYLDVEEKCWKGAETGKIYNNKNEEVFGFYVHPFSGCLEFRDLPIPLIRPAPETVVVKIDERTRYHKLDGIWYYETVTKNDYHSLYTPWLSSYTVISRKQLNNTDLKRLGLKNESYERQLELKEERLKKEKEMLKSPFIGA